LRAVRLTPAIFAAAFLGGGVGLRDVLGCLDVGFFTPVRLSSALTRSVYRGVCVGSGVALVAARFGVDARAAGGVGRLCVGLCVGSGLAAATASFVARLACAVAERYGVGAIGGTARGAVLLLAAQIILGGGAPAVPAVARTSERSEQ
jgi:hypothetical protein